MTDLARRGPIGLKRPKEPKAPRNRIVTRPKRKTAEERAHIAAVKCMRCIICGWPGPSDFHHCISGRFGSRKRSDAWGIPLCRGCHQDGPEAIHKSKAAWEAMHGPDIAFLPRVYAALGKELPEEIKEELK